MAEDKHVDESWKQRIQAEKEKLRTEPAPAPQGGRNGAPPAGGEMPDANFLNFISGLATQALLALGQGPHPATGQVEVNLEEAKYLIDVLRMLEAKTRTNLTPEEAKAFKDLLYNLQMAFVAVSKKFR